MKYRMEYRHWTADDFAGFILAGLILTRWNPTAQRRTSWYTGIAKVEAR